MSGRLIVCLITANYIGQMYIYTPTSPRLDSSKHHRYTQEQNKILNLWGNLVELPWREYVRRKGPMTSYNPLMCSGGAHWLTNYSLVGDKKGDWKYQLYLGLQ